MSYRPVTCKGSFRNVAGCLLTPILGQYYVLIIRNRRGNWMLPGGMVDEQDKRADHPCFRTLEREFGEELGFPMPGLTLLDQYAYHERTLITIASFNVNDLQTFQPNNEATEAKLVEIAILIRNGFTEPPFEGYVRRSFLEMAQAGKFDRFLKS